MFKKHFIVKEILMILIVINSFFKNIKDLLYKKYIINLNER